MIILADIYRNGILPYVYRLDNPLTGEFYIGYRQANKVRPEDDLGIFYKTSSRRIKKQISDFDLSIIAVFFTDYDAYWFEQELIEAHSRDPKNLNGMYHKYRSGKIFGCSDKINSQKLELKFLKR